MMDLKDTILISSIQKKLVKWLSFCKFISYSKLYEGCFQLIMQESFSLKREPSRTMFYRVLFPLIKVGVIEYGFSENEGIIFFLPPENGDTLIKRKANDCSRFDPSYADINKARKAGKMILAKLPSVKEYVKKIEEENIQGFKFKQNDENFSLSSINDTSNKEVGIYKTRNLAFFPFYLVDREGISHKLKSFRESLEEMDYAHSYVLLAKGKQIFEYNEVSKTICFLFQSTVPLFVIRAMCLIDPNVLKEEDLYLGKSVFFHVSDIDVVKELNRIYGVRQ